MRFDLVADLRPRPFEPKALHRAQGRPPRADEVLAAAPPNGRQIRVADKAAVNDPHPALLAVRALHHPHHRLPARQPDRALGEYRAALDLRPDYAEALFGAARAALDVGRAEEARRDYERFIRIAPSEYRQQIAAAREALRRLEASHR